MRAAHAVCAITDPFCEAASGAKWPDADTQVNTVPWTVRGFIPVTTDVNGDASVLICPELVKFDENVGPRYANGTIAGNVVTYSGDWDQIAPDGTVGNIIGTQRVVSAGVRILTTTSLQTSQGVVFVQQVPGGTDVDFTNTPFGSLNYPRVDTFSMKSTQPIFHVFQAGSMDSRTLSHVDLDGPVSTTDTDDWSLVQIQVTGAQASTEVLVVEFIGHYEFTVAGAGRWLNALATKPAPAHPSLIAASKAVTSSIPTIQGTVQGFGSIVHSSAMAALKGLAQTAAVYGAKAIGGYFGGPAGGMLAGGATRLAIQDLD